MKVKTIEQKLKTSYATSSLSKGVKDIDMTKRTVTGLFNSYFYIDADFDMLLPGAAKKSIQERGVGTTSGNKIKHLKDHNFANVMARLDVLDEREVSINGKSLKGIYHESFYPDTTDSNDLLIKIQEGLYDDRSIGFRYINLVFADADSQNEDNRNNWEIPNTSGKWVYAIPGINLSVSDTFSVRLSGKIPLYRNLDGTQLTTRFTTSLTFYYTLTRNPFPTL